MFQLLKPTTVKLAHINVRTEKHGTSDVDAFDLDFLIEGENSKVLALLDPKLCAALYYDEDAEEGQETVDGVPPSLPNRRFPKLAESIKWDDEATGVDLVVIYGLGDDISNIKLEGGKACTKRLETKEGGSASVAFSFSASGYPDGVLDKLRKKLKQELSITMVRPEKLRADAVIDGTVGHPGASAAAAAENADQRSLLDPPAERTPEQALVEATAGEGGAPAAAASDAAEFEAGAAKALANANVKPKRGGRKPGAEVR